MNFPPPWLVSVLLAIVLQNVGFLAASPIQTPSVTQQYAAVESPSVDTAVAPAEDSANQEGDTDEEEDSAPEAEAAVPQEATTQETSKRTFNSANEDGRIQIFDKKMDDTKKAANDAYNRLKDKVIRTTSPGRDREHKLSTMKRKKDRVERGITASKRNYKKMETGARGNAARKAKLTKLGDNIQEGGSSAGESAADMVDQWSALLDPDTSWQEKAQNALAFAGIMTAFMPSPMAELASVVFDVVGSIFGTAAPSVDDFKLLRNEIIEGTKGMFDEKDLATAKGVVFKAEFIKQLLDIERNGEPWSNEEFYSIILVGGVDLGITTMGTLKYKMKTYRDSNTIADGRKALNMAKTFVLIYEARTMLNNEIMQYLKISENTAGLSARFFQRTQQLAKNHAFSTTCTIFVIFVTILPH